MKTITGLIKVTAVHTHMYFLPRTSLQVISKMYLEKHLKKNIYHPYLFTEMWQRWKSKSKTSLHVFFTLRHSFLWYNHSIHTPSAMAGLWSIYKVFSLRSALCALCALCAVQRVPPSLVASSSVHQGLCQLGFHDLPGWVQGQFQIRVAREWFRVDLVLRGVGDLLEPDGDFFFIVKNRQPFKTGHKPLRREKQRDSFNWFIFVISSV